MEYEEPEIRDYGQRVDVLDATDSHEGPAMPADLLRALLAERTA